MVHAEKDAFDVPRAHRWEAPMVTIGKQFAIAALAAATIMAVVLGNSPRTEQAVLMGGNGGIHIVHLPDGQVEMEYAAHSIRQPQQLQQQRQMQLAGAQFGPYAGGALAAQRGPSGYAPDSETMRQAYRFAEENRPSVTRVFDRRSYGVEQARLRGRHVERDAVSRSGRLWKPPAAVYNSLQSQLNAIHQDQVQQAKAGIAEESQIETFTDPTILSNELMQQGANVIVNQARAERAHSMDAMMKSKSVSALKAKSSAKSAELASAVESSVLQGKHVKLEAPARMMSLAEQPASTVPAPADLAVSPGDGGKIQSAIPPVPSGGDGCAGGVLCAIPTNNVAIQALEARLQADEIAISTLTRDVSELTKQTEDLQKPIPLPAGARPS